MPSRHTRSAALAAGWTLAAVVAVGGGLIAVGEVGDGIVANQAGPMSHQEIVDRLAVPTTTTGDGKGSVPTDSTQVFGSDGGTVLAGCVGGNAFVRSATPAPGYSVDDEIEAESKGRVKVEFKKGKAEVEVTVDCGTGVPVATIAQDDDD